MMAVVAKKKSAVSAPEPVAETTRPRKPKATPVGLAEQFATLRRRAIVAIADNFIFDKNGQEAYKRSGSAYAVVGKYKVSATFLDWHDELHDASGIADGKARIAALKALCKKAGA